MGDPTHSSGSVGDEDDLVEQARGRVEVELFAAERLAFLPTPWWRSPSPCWRWTWRFPRRARGRPWARRSGTTATSTSPFLLSFFIIANAWVSHHALFGYVRKADRRLLSINLIWLLAIVVAPFFTRLVVDDHVFFEFRFLTYALLQVVLSLLMWLLVRHARRADLLLAATPDRAIDVIVLRSMVVAIPFALSIPLAFAIGQPAFYVWYFGPTAAALLLRAVRHRRGEEESG